MTNVTLFLYWHKKSYKIAKGCSEAINRRGTDNTIGKELEAQWAEPVSNTCHSILRKLYIEPSICVSHKISINFATWL